MVNIRRYFNFYFLAMSLIFISCRAQKEINAYEIEDGFYKSRIYGEKKELVYLDNEPDYLSIFPVYSSNGYFFLDTMNREIINFPQKNIAAKIEDEIFQTNEFDIDLISIPFKFRSSRQGIPPQLNTNLNASMYFGYRTDWYTLGYQPSPFGEYERLTRHYGVTFGAFSGISAIPVNPWLTRDNINYEYDGIAWSYGVAVSFAFNYLNIGVGLGWDYLLDNNSRFWIYQNKPWLGLVLGINLN
jgi:hypothetical protein